MARTSSSTSGGSQDDGSAPGKARSWRSPFRLAVILLVVLIAVAAIVWWQDRPLGKAESLLVSGEAEAALQAVDGYLQRRPHHQAARTLKGRVLVALRRWEEADREFKEAGAATPADMRAWATALLYRQQWRDARPLFEQVAAQGPADAETLRGLTLCRFQLGEREAALESATRLTAIPGQEVQGLFQTGVIHRSMGNTHLAIDCWERIEQRAPEGEGLPVPAAEFFRVHAKDLIRECRERAAVEYFQKSIDLQSDPPVLVELGDAWFKLGRDEAANQAWISALDKDPENREARRGLAELALKRADGAAALRWLEPIAANPQITPAIAYLMQRAHTALGHEEQAQQWQEQTAILRKSEKLQAAFRDRK